MIRNVLTPAFVVPSPILLHARRDGSAPAVEIRPLF
jgi:hypothetical protein